MCSDVENAECKWATCKCKPGLSYHNATRKCLPGIISKFYDHLFHLSKKCSINRKNVAMIVTITKDKIKENNFLYFLKSEFSTKVSNLCCDIENKRLEQLLF